MKKSIWLAAVFSLSILTPAIGQWRKIDTVTSGNYIDHNPRIDHSGLQIPVGTGRNTADEGEWMIFERDSNGVSWIAGKRFWFQHQTWDATVTEVAPPISGIEQTSPDLCGMMKGYDSLIVLAAWLRRENGVRSIYYSTTVGDSTGWAAPRKLIDDTVNITNLKLRSNWSSVFVTWVRGNIILCSLFYPDSVLPADTLVVSNFDSVEYDLNAYSIVWTFRDSTTGRICMATGSVTLGPPSKVSAVDTLRSSGDIRNPAIGGGYYQFETFEVRIADRVEVRGVVVSSSPGVLVDYPLLAYPNAIILNFGSFSLGYDRYWIWEQQSSSDTLIIFSYGYESPPATIDTFSGGHNPVMGSIAQFAYGPFPINTFINVAVWESSAGGKSIILGRAFLPYIPDAVKGNPVPNEFYHLYQNYPNPFNPSTVISYQLPTLSHVTLKIYDLLGREVATLVDERKSPGTYDVKFDGSAFPSGVYFCRIIAGNYISTRKIMLLK